MSSRKDPWKRIGRPGYEGVHLLPFDLEKRAAAHEFNRERVVAKVYSDLFCMVCVGLVDTTKPISCSGAGSQSLGGSRSRNTEAAHCAPRQIFVGTQKLQDILLLKFPSRSLAIDALFGETDILPSNFNKADSRAEACGLADAFRFGAEVVTNEAKMVGSLEQMRMVMAIKNAYMMYRDRAEHAFKDAQHQLKDKVRDIERSRITHTIRTKEETKWREQLEITRIYSSTLEESPGLEEAIRPEILTGLARIYSEFKG